MKRYIITKGLIMHKLGSKTVLFDSDKSILYTLNETATMIFKQLKKGLTDEEITDDIEKTYHIDRKRAAQDVQQLISDFCQKKIIR